MRAVKYTPTMGFVAPGKKNIIFVAYVPLIKTGW
jgi:hypothetical protein